MLVPESLLPAFTILHVAISLVAIVGGFVVVYGLIVNRRWPGWTALFLTTTVATSVTGFLFPIHGVTPGIVLGIVSLVVLPVTGYALYSKHLVGIWRSVYVIGAVLSFYLNFLVLIVQSFQKVSGLHALAPTQSEPPFLVAQTAALLMFVAFGVLGLKRFERHVSAS